MRNISQRYICYPSVVQVGKETEITVFPTDPSRVFRAEKQYEMCVVGLLEDQLDSYHKKIPHDHPCYVKNGCLCFKYCFDKEQEYSIRFCETGGKEIKVSLYAVQNDLYSLRPLKGDLHTHSYYSDGADGVPVTPADYREEGFDFFALTDHNRMFTSKLAAELYDGVPLGMNIMPGEEVHTPGSLLHIVHVGGNYSVCNKYIHDPDTYEAQVDETEKTLSYIPEQYRRRAAMAVWACDKIHKAGGLAIFAHPFWCPNRYNITDEFMNILFDLKIFDAFELMGGIDQTKNNMQLALWQQQMSKGNIIPIVGSSDSHNHDFAKDGFARRFTLVFASENTTSAVLDAVKDGLCVAGEISSKDDDEVRFYGDLRLVSFAHFLWRNFFKETWRICFGEGVLMRRYAQGEPVEKELALACDTVSDFYKRYYGILPAPVIPDKIIKYLDKCRAVQTGEGPVTKGSSLFIYGGNERRE